jgi:hypothetical protein
LEQARSAFLELERWIVAPETLASTLDDVEREQEKRGREVQRLLLQAHMERRGLGDVGPAVEVTVHDGGRRRRRRHGQRRRHTRKVLSIFGAVAVARLAYHAAEAASVHPLDEQASLPERTWSYEVQRRLVVGSIQGPFDEALERVKESTGLVVSKRSAEEILRDAAESFDAFYEQRRRGLPPPSKTAPILVAALDRKGVPMVKPEAALRTVRPGKGKKANKKRMATVAAVYTQEPRVRTPEKVVESLFREGPRIKRGENDAPRWPGPENKRVWASLERSVADVVAEAVDEVKRRDPRGLKTRAVVVDGERGLSQRAGKGIEGGVEILDLLHATEKLWKCAYVFHEEGSEDAKAWVKKYTLEILRGKVSQVVKGIRSSATKRGLEGSEREVVDSATGYLYRNRRRMRYDEYLALGLPIASGSVEGACKNLVKDRMERSGMRWTMETGEAMLRLRAVYLSGDFEAYWAFHLRREDERLYPRGRWRVTGK